MFSLRSDSGNLAPLQSIRIHLDVLLRAVICSFKFMEQQPDSEDKIEVEATKKYVIPPPDLSKKSFAPPSPVGGLPHVSSSPVLLDDGPVKIHLKAGKSDPQLEDEDLQAEDFAAFNPRMVAAMIDLLVGLGVTIGLSWLLPGFALRLAYLAGLGYFVTRDSLPFLDGQSVGKKAMKLNVTTQEGVSLVRNWKVSLIRNGILLIPFFALLEVYILLSREGGVDRGLRLGDEWAKTRVSVDRKPKISEESE